MKTAVIYDKWLHQFGGAELVACTIAEILKKDEWEVSFISGKDTEMSKIQDKFGIDLTGVKCHVVWNDEQALKKIVQGKDLFINASFMDYSYGYAKQNLYYTHFPTPLRGFLFNAGLAFFQLTGLHDILPARLKLRIHDRIRAGIFFDMKKRLESYDVILANSEFTKKWIRNYWNMDSQVLYPPVKDIVEMTGLKKNWITSVGRFFTLGHGKKQEVMIEAFKRLSDEVEMSDLQLHLVGGVGQEPSSVRYVEQLKNMAKGYPVYFHFNIPHAEVIDILRDSKVYWHATGYGENEKTNPMAFEHFGIAPVEAISAGCYPLLFDGGGLREIIAKADLPTEKHLFVTIEELIKKTKECIGDGDMAPVREKVSAAFGQGRFRAEVSKMVA